MPRDKADPPRSRATSSHAKTAAPSHSPEAHTLQLASGRVEYLLKWSSRARRLRLVVRSGGQIEVAAPVGTPLSHVEQVLREKALWLARAQERMQAVASPTEAPTQITDGVALAFAGEHLHLHLVHEPSLARAHAHLQGGVLTLRVPTLDQADLHALLERWYRHRGKALFEERLTICNTHYAYHFARVTLKDQRSRWGSCSQKGNLNFNWRLLLAPLPVLDYVVIHELAHLKVPNHSPRFWAVVAETCPDYAVHRKWLRLHGHTLKL